MHRQIRAAISTFGLCALLGSAASASFFPSFGHRGFRPHGGGSFFYSSRPSYYGGWAGRYGRSRSSFGLSFYFGSPYYYDPFWYDPYYYSPVYTRPTVVYVHDDDYYLSRRSDRAEPRDYGIDRSRRAREDDANDYYLYRRRPASSTPSSVSTSDAGLKAAIDDIQTAFQVGDITRLEKHVAKSGKIVLTVKSTTRRDIGVDDYLQATRDAFKDMKTQSYELTKIEPASNGAWLVTGKHAVIDDEKIRSYQVSFVLKRDGDNWVIAEVGADPMP